MGSQQWLPFWFCGYLKWHGDGAEWMVPIE
jgi:hypothetical protein